MPFFVNSAANLPVKVNEFASVPAATMALQRTLQTKGHSDGVAKDSRSFFFSRSLRFPEAGILINCHIYIDTNINTHINVKKY